MFGADERGKSDGYVEAVSTVSGWTQKTHRAAAAWFDARVQGADDQHSTGHSLHHVVYTYAQYSICYNILADRY